MMCLARRTVSLGRGHVMTWLSKPRPNLQAGLVAPRESHRNFAADEGGATAVEFALIATPFFALLFALGQTAMLFWSTQVLETAVANASRQIYTGQFQSDPTNAGLTAAQLQQKFKELVCQNVPLKDAATPGSGYVLFDCSKLDVDIQTFGTTWTAPPSSPVSNGVYNPSGYGYQTPGRGQIVVVRASMEYPTIVPMASATGLKSGNQLMMASAAFLTEP
jgi:Flp pilus assembly protein TadG